MIAHILSTGEEVLLGDITDTNAAFLARRLKESGIRTQKTYTVGDDRAVLAETLRAIAGEAEICIVTGGLGPTVDDVTAEACADAASDTLVESSTALAGMRAYFKRRGFELTPENRKQALLPATAKILVNRHGTAPGFYITINHCLFFFLPGVPSEMKPMFTDQVRPILLDRFKLDSPLRIDRITVFGLGESKVGALLKGFDQAFPACKLGFRASFPMIEVKVTAGAADAASNLSMDKAKSWVIQRLGTTVVSADGLSLAQEVGRLLVSQGKTLAVAESCTGGLIASMMTDVSGSSDYFLFSGVTYSNEAKIGVLGVEKKTLIECGAVHERTAAQMALGARKTAGADWAVSTTGIAGPTGGTKEKPVGLVCIGIAGKGFSRAQSYTFPYDDRLMNKQIFAATALENLRQELVKGAGSGSG